MSTKQEATEAVPEQGDLSPALPGRRQPWPDPACTQTWPSRWTARRSQGVAGGDVLTVTGAGRGRVREVPSIGGMSFSWDNSRTAFADAAGWFVRTTALVGDRWDQPGLGEWDVRALVGHTSRSLLTVETYLARPAPAAEIASSAGYFRATRAAAADAAVAARGREAGAALGSDPAAAVAQIAARVLALVDTKDGTELVTTIAGGMRLADYLPTRAFELAVHTADLATVLGVPPDVPATAAVQALAIVTDLAVTGGLAGPLLLAATGRPGLPVGFSVL
jgi:Mycothiol maleylpyruvate isomerase N-terminal domain